MAESDRFEDGAVLVAKQTDPDWVPVMKRASAVVTDSGGRTSHAAIVSRELGIAAIVGATGACDLLDGHQVTVSCAEGPTGTVYDGVLPYREDTLDLTAMPTTRTAIMLNVADPAMAMRWWRLPVRGIGLARIEFVIEHMAKAHPMALLHPERLSDDDRRAIAMLTQGYATPAEFFVDRLAAGIAQIAASQWPEPVIVRFSDFKTNEYAGLLGGREFEPHEENPMIGFRGASRYYDERYREGFGLECRAIRRVREVIGLRNVVVMIPFCRTLEEADKVLAEMRGHGLVRGEAGLEVYVMAEIPSNVLLAREFGARFDGFSIGSNDLTQLTLGVDRDNALLASLFDERNPAVLRSIERLIADAHAVGCKVGICGQAPSDHPEFAEFLVRAGIDSISLNPDSVVPVLQRVAALEETTKGGP
jgi:pyruvate,water dikinase